jgi:hypothetical protein
MVGNNKGVTINVTKLIETICGLGLAVTILGLIIYYGNGGT